jgi:signal peptidase II
LRHPVRTFWLVAVAVFVLDQLTKSAVRVLWSAAASQLPIDAVFERIITPVYVQGESVPVLGNALRLTHVRNTGAAFGLFPGYQPLFILTSLVVLLVVAVYWHRARPTAAPVVIALALVSSGALGNLVDRAILGKVTDFVDVAPIDFPVFNVADSAIFIGVGILVVWLLFGPQEERSEERTVGTEPQVEVEAESTQAAPGDAVPETPSEGDALR